MITWYCVVSIPGMLLEKIPIREASFLLRDASSQTQVWMSSGMVAYPAE